MLNYAIVGGGRLARHFSRYFQLLNVPHQCWARNAGSSFNSFRTADAEQRLRQTLAGTDRVLLLVPDHAIEELLGQFPFLNEKRLIHCSGALSIPGVAAAHPLMTFAGPLYDLDLYRSIPFVLEKGQDFSELFPSLPNPSFNLDIKDKARYHAMCVIAGNFPQLLWKEVLDRFERQFEWPGGILEPYLKQVTANFLQDPQAALTGPLVRNDHDTIERNMLALNDDPLQPVYQAFVNLYRDKARENQAVGPRNMEYSS